MMASSSPSRIQATIICGEWWNPHCLLSSVIIISYKPSFSWWSRDLGRRSRLGSLERRNKWWNEHLPLASIGPLLARLKNDDDDDKWGNCEVLVGVAYHRAQVGDYNCWRRAMMMMMSFVLWDRRCVKNGNLVILLSNERRRWHLFGIQHAVEGGRFLSSSSSIIYRRQIIYCDPPMNEWGWMLSKFPPWINSSPH